MKLQEGKTVFNWFVGLSRCLEEDEMDKEIEEIRCSGSYLELCSTLTIQMKLQHEQKVFNHVVGNSALSECRSFLILEEEDEIGEERGPFSVGIWQCRVLKNVKLDWVRRSINGFGGRCRAVR